MANGVVLSSPAVGAAQAAPAVEKIVLAIHGIGDQSENETIVSTVARFCDYYQYPALIPLGAFHQVLRDGTPAFTFTGPPPHPQLVGQIGFAEVYWASIPRRVARRGYVLQETKKWARTIVDRVRVLDRLANAPNATGTTFSVRRLAQHPIRHLKECKKRSEADVDYGRIRQVLAEMISGISVIESLLFLGKKAGIVDFNLKKLLDDYLGDVQVVTEFAAIRERIRTQFNTMILRRSGTGWPAGDGLGTSGAAKN